MQLSEVLEYLHAVARAELDVRRAVHIEPSERKFGAMLSTYNELIGRRSGISRAFGEPAAYFKTPEQAEAAAQLQPRSVFAVARYRQGKKELFRGWLGDTELGHRGEGMVQNLFLNPNEGRLKVVAEYGICYTCMGALRLQDGEDCQDCTGGWVFEFGTHIRKMGKVVEVLRLQEPSDPLYKPAYALITDPD